MTATDAAARLRARPVAGPAFGVAFCALLLGGIVWVVSGWLSLPRAFLISVLACAGLFAALEAWSRRRTARLLTPSVDLFAALAARLDGVSLGHHRSMPWVAGGVGGDEVTLHVEWIGAERLRLGITVHTPSRYAVWMVSRQADTLPEQFIERLRTRRRLVDVELADDVLALAPDPGPVEAAWRADPSFADAARSAIEAMLPHASALELHTDGVSWEGPADATAAAGAARVIEIVEGLKALAIAVAARDGLVAAVEPVSDSERTR